MDIILRIMNVDIQTVKSNDGPCNSYNICLHSLLIDPCYSFSDFRVHGKDGSGGDFQSGGQPGNHAR